MKTAVRRYATTTEQAPSIRTRVSQTGRLGTCFFVAGSDWPCNNTSVVLAIDRGIIAMVPRATKMETALALLREPGRCVHVTWPGATSRPTTLTASTGSGWWTGLLAGSTPGRTPR